MKERKSTGREANARDTESTNKREIQNGYGVPRQSQIKEEMEKERDEKGQRNVCFHSIKLEATRLGERYKRMVNVCTQAYTTKGCRKNCVLTRTNSSSTIQTKLQDCTRRIRFAN